MKKVTATNAATKNNKNDVSVEQAAIPAETKRPYEKIEETDETTTHKSSRIELSETKRLIELLFLNNELEPLASEPRLLSGKTSQIGNHLQTLKELVWLEYNRVRRLNRTTTLTRDGSTTPQLQRSQQHHTSTKQALTPLLTMCITSSDPLIK